MTIIFSVVTKTIIVMASDSAITNYFSESKEYDIDSKSYFVQDAACVTTWGSRDGNQIGRFVHNLSNSSQKYSIEIIKEKVFDYLQNEYNPKDMDLDDVGYHIGGYTESGQPKLYHVFWGYDRPRRPEQLYREYKICDHSLNQGDIHFLYNGRNDIAESIVHSILRLFRDNSDVKFRFNDAVDIIRFSDFVVRVGCELTPEVGLPIVIRFLLPNNKVGTLKHSDFCPLDADGISEKLSSLR